MLKSIPGVFIVLFFLVFLLTGSLVIYLYFKTGDINTIFNLKQVSNSNQSEGYLLPDGSEGYTPIGYTSVSTDGKHALVVGKILEINKDGDEISGKVSVSEDDHLVVRVIFASDVAKDTLYIKEQRTDDFFPVSADYKTSELKGGRIEAKLRERVGKLLILSVNGDDSVCNQHFISSKAQGVNIDAGCELKVRQVHIKTR